MLIARDRRPRDGKTSGLIELDELMREHDRIAVVSNDDDGERTAWLQDQATAFDGIMVHGHELAALPDGDRRSVANVGAAFIDAGSWLVRDPLARVSIAEDVTTVCWSVCRDHVGDFLDNGYLVAEIEPESFPAVPEASLTQSAPEAVQLGLTVPLHRRTLIEATGPVGSVDELYRLTTGRLVGAGVDSGLGDLAQRLRGSDGQDATAEEIESKWSVIRHADVVECLAGRTTGDSPWPPDCSASGRSAVIDAHRPTFVALPGGSLAQTSTTVRQFACFVDAGGYREPIWWSSGRPSAASPARFEEQRPFPNRPVVGVAFAEAEAYCSWLSAELGRAVSLPSLETWRAACGEGFPWGEDDRDPAERANHGQLVGDLTDVGAYPLGAGPHGHLDLAGNCWEWIADPDGDSRRVVVGGGWFTRITYLRSDYTFRFDEGNRFRDLGFRVAGAGAGSGNGLAS